MKKRILSMILAIAMIASLFTGLGFTASAVAAPASGEYVIAANVDGTYYAMSAAFGSKISSKVVTVTNGTVSAADAEGYTVTLTSTADGYTISNGEVYLAYNSGTNFKTVTTLENAAYWTVADGVLGTYRFANAATVTRGVVFRASTYNQFGAYAVSNVTENGTEYYDLELLTVDTGTVWTWDGNVGQNGYHTEVNQNNETRQVACTPDSTGVINPAPTCVDTGVETFLCTVCGGVADTTVLPTVAHTYVNGVCTVCGALEPQLDGYVLADSLRVGDKIIFVDETGGKAAGALAGNGTSTYLSAVDATIADGVAVSADALVFEVEAGSAAGTFHFRNGEDNYLYASKAASSSNYLYLNNSMEDTPEDLDWTVTFADGLADVSYCSSAASNGRHLRYNVNNNNPRFSGYTTASTNIRNVAIYKLATGEDLVDVYFVDQDDNANAYAYAFGSGVENAPFPGEQLTAQGVDENGDNYYKITLDRAIYTNVIFSGGASDTQTANLGLGTASNIVYYVYQDNGVQASVGDDVWPGPGTVIAPTCTEPGCTRYVGLLTGVVHEVDITDATGHDWGAWTFNGDNTHTRVCANDATHTETDYCVDENEDGVCDVCGSELVVITGAVEPGAYVIAAKIGDDYYALPNAMTANNPDGALIPVTDGMVDEADAEGYIFNLKLLINGQYTIDNGEKYLGGGASGTNLHGLPMEDALTNYYRWTIETGEYGSWRVTNVGVPNRGLIYQDNSNVEPAPTTVYTRFGNYVTGNVNGETYFDIELLPVVSAEPESPEEIDVWFVDQTGVQTPYVYYFDENYVPDPLDTAEDLQFPGRPLTALGTDKDGNPYYKITLSTDEYTHVIFNNGQTGGTVSGNQTIDLEFAADAMTNPADPNANRYVVYYIHRDNGIMCADIGTDIWPAPGVVTEPTCEESGYTTYTGLITGEKLIPGFVDPLGHDYVPTVTEATCTEQGYTTYTCSRCGDYYFSDFVNALGHDYVAVVTEPTCTEPGFTTCTCSRCGDVYTADATEALGHLPGEPVQENYVEPTETEDGGYDMVVYCQRCNAELSREHTVLPHPEQPVEPIETSDLHIYNSISVGTDMVITFTVRKNDLTNYSNFWIEVVKHNPDGDVAYTYNPDVMTEGTSTWAVQFRNIYAKEMGIDVEARLYAENAAGQIYMSPAKNANIRDYLGGRLTATNNKVEQRVLAADMLNYGAAAQMFTGFETDHLVNEELTADQLAKLHQYETTALPAVNKTNTNYRPAGVSNILFTSVTLGNEVLLNLTIRLAEGTEGVQVLVKDHETGEVVTTLETTFLGSTFSATFNGIGADKMRTEYDLVTIVNGVETGNTRTWSVEAYVGEIRTEGIALKVAMGNALLTYGDSAAAYFDAMNAGIQMPEAP